MHRAVLLESNALPWLDAAGLAAAGVESAVLLAIVAVFLASICREPMVRALQLSREAPSTQPFDRVLYVLGTLALSQLLDRLIDVLSLRDGSQIAAIEGTLAGSASGELPLLLGALAVAPALAEEMLFRGLALRQLGLRYGMAVAVAGSAVLFGVVHQDLAQGGAAVALGVYLAFVAIVTGSIRTAVLCHLCNNALAVAASLPAAFGVAVSTEVGAGIDGICLLLLYAASRRLVQRWPKHWPDPPPQQPRTAP